MTFTLIATTTMGFEAVLAREIKALGYKDVKVFDHKVEFQGDYRDICRANIWLRTAGRIYIKIGEFEATTFDELFDKTTALDWAQWIGKDDKFPVADVTSRKSALFSKSDCQSIVKKAVVTQLKKAHSCETLPETKASCPIRIQIENDKVILSIDSSGSGLNKRGYRAHMDIAPLRETLAAGLILLSRWRPEEDMLMDPFCGTGTLLIEAGLIAKNIAPGLNRSFCSERWSCIDSAHWRYVRQEARDLIKKDAKYRIYGSDNNARALSIANKNIELAGLPDVFVQKRELSEISSRYEQGRIITNPPYGHRLEEQPDIDLLYQEMGRVFKEKFPLWSYYVLTSCDYFEELFGRESNKHRKIYNGGIKCWYYQFFGRKS
ncbi:RNA methyltransferase [Candidatus Marinamargulisbacteria bacterium SCGC AG-343-D04]|nr:RNA methyltransferase [Candidatus Marinamargulisbacteria bacterium SCGC AG-343-D04]